MRGSLLVLVLVLAAPLRAQEAAEAYETGLQRFGAGDDRAAVERLTRAIALAPAETKHLLVSGTHFEVYLPHLYLGLALKRLGETERARRELLESRRQGVSPSYPEAKRLLDAALDDLSAPSRAPTPAAVATPPPTPRPEMRPVPSPAAPAPTAGAAASPAPTHAPSPSATRTVPATPSASAEERNALKRGIREFFDGRYERAVLTLETPGLSKNDLARLFAAYSACGAFLVGGEGDGDALARAASLYRSVPEPLRKRARVGISPRILETLAAPAPSR